MTATGISPAAGTREENGLTQTERTQEMITLDIEVGSKQHAKITLNPMMVSDDQITLSDGGQYFLTLTREQLTDLVSKMDEEFERNKHED